MTPLAVIFAVNLGFALAASLVNPRNSGMLGFSAVCGWLCAVLAAIDAP